MIEAQSIVEDWNFKIHLNGRPNRERIYEIPACNDSTILNLAGVINYGVLKVEQNDGLVGG
jgi:hypothetical protein